MEPCFIFSPADLDSRQTQPDFWAASVATKHLRPLGFLSDSPLPILVIRVQELLHRSAMIPVLKTHWPCPSQVVMKLHVQLQCKNLHQYLRELSPEVLDRLYNHPATCLAVYRYGRKHACVWVLTPLTLTCCLQGAALLVQELCDANAVLGAAAPPGSCVSVGPQRQSEVSSGGKGGSRVGLWDRSSSLSGTLSGTVVLPAAGPRLD